MRERLMAARLACGSLTVRAPDGRVAHNHGQAPGPHGEITLHRWRALSALLRRGDLGFSEAYVAGDWDSPDIASVIELAARNRSVTRHVGEGTVLSRIARRRRHAARANTRVQARSNITAHYDLGNDFYAQWLDQGLSYSSALYSDPQQSLEAAQTAKQDRVLELLAPGPGDRVLEIGCGWGGLAERIVRRTGGMLTGLTLSPAQAEYARQRLAGLPADIALRDYRDETGIYDRIVSIEMLEAVGAAYWPQFFRRVHDCLRPGGRAVLQVITIAEERFETYLRRPDFIQHHIFPGGMLPTISIIEREVAAAGLRLSGLEHFGQSYARTLAEWRQRFESAWDGLRAQGFDEQFRRKWRYYLAYCEGGFRAGSIDVGLYTLEKA